MTKVRQIGNRARLLCCVLAAIQLACCARLALGQERLRVGVWNIEKLSDTAKRGFPELRGDDALPARTNSDLVKMAKYIRDELQVDALMVTEIDADSPFSTSQRPQSKQLNAVAAEMGDNWKYFLGRTGEKLRLGLLFNTDRVRLKKLVNLQAPEFPVTGKDVLARDPFIAWISAVDDGDDKNDLILICVHLKSQQGPFKDNRMAAIAKLIGDFNNSKIRNALTLPSKNEEPEAILLGDCNDSSFKRSGFKYMFDYLKGVGFAHVRNSSGSYPHTRVNGSQIDHLFATKKVRNEAMVDGSFKVHTVPSSQRFEYRKSLSDHFPVTIDLKIRDDDDFTLQEAFAEQDPAERERRMAALQEDAFARALEAAPTTQGLDDEEDENFVVEAEILDDGFEQILAPTAIARAARENAEAPGRGTVALETVAGNSRQVVPSDRYAKSDLPVKFLDQNWSPAESVEFYSLQQGSPIMRRDFFNILEQPDSTELFRDSEYLAGFGFLPRRPHEGNLEGYPVGFTGEDAIELTCAACHTSKLTYQGTEYWIDGSQAMTDMESFLDRLVSALKLTAGDAPDLSGFRSNQRIELSQATKFGRFVRKLVGGNVVRVAQARVILDLLNKEIDRRQRYNDYNDYGRTFANDAERDAATGHQPYGFGRLDALGAILNQASAEMIDRPVNARRANAPVNYPAIWDAPQHVHVQWNGSVDNTARFGPLGRNAGQVIGVFGLVEIEGTTIGYDSSIRFDGIRRAEDLVTKLWSPPWPEEFGIDQAKASAGATVYQANCVQCHSIINRKDPQRRANDVLVPIHRVYGQNGVLGTDDLTAKNWQDRSAQVGPLAGRSLTLPFSGSFPDNPSASVPARDILSHLVFNAIARSFVPWRDELTLADEHARSMTFAAPESQGRLMRYKARPLNGVWSTAPYLHNGSVLDMVELLTPPAERKSEFRVGTTAFDPATLGYKDDGPFLFKTSQPDHPGNSNQGHAYGTELSAEEKLQLIEFLKTL